MRRTPFIATALALTMGVAACGGDDGDTGSGEGASEDALTVGLITKFPVDFYDTMVDAVEAWDEEHDDVEVVYGQGESGTDDEGVIAQIESMVTQQVDAIAITPTSPNVENALQDAVDAGIEVVLIDNDIPGWDGKSSVVATDNLAGGRLAGEWLAGELEPGSEVLVLQGVLGNPSLEDRVTGMVEGLGDAGTVVGEGATDCDQTRGLDVAQDLLTAHPDVAAIYGACGPPIVGALEAVEGSGRDPSELVIVGFDASPDEVTAIVDGRQTASVAQFPARMGTIGVETAVAAARGEPVEPTIDTGTEMVTSENAAEFQ